ncbi:MAG: AAA family ATPase [Clostridium sp.]|jgi:DNA repair exonuclease SbcCD ATPase subunit|nr:AAA family ATPase [Clostridium sp.]
MNIDKLDIIAFGKFNNLILELSDGLNVIYGANEAGKTTIQWFIRGMLYSLKGGRAGKSGDLPPLKRFKPWRGNDYMGSIAYRLDDGSRFTVERDFNESTVKVYDSMYNDITASFEQSRKQGALFALKHLGINESCFERTVFIGQMDTKIDAAGSKELLDRLSNIRESGAEDISYKRAREALTEALTCHVGTERTTTRPLDVVNQKLDELKLKRKGIIEERERLLEAYEKLNRLVSFKKSLEKRKHALIYANQAIDLRKNIESLKKQRKELSLILEGIGNYEREKSIIFQHIEEYNETIRRYEPYSRYIDDDSAHMSILFERLKEAKEKNKKLLEKTRKLREEAENLAVLPEEIKGLKSIDINDFIWYRLIKTGIFIAALAAGLAGMAAIFFPSWTIKAAAICVFVLLLSIFVYAWKRKAYYENLALRLNELKSSMDLMEEEISRNEQYINEVKPSIVERLKAGNIIAHNEDEVEKEHIETFENELFVYGKALKDVELKKEKYEDIEHYLQSIYDRVSSAYGIWPCNRDAIKKAYNNISKKMDRLYEDIEVCTYRIKALYSKEEFSKEYDELSEKILDADIINAQSYIEEKINLVDSDINETMHEISKVQALTEVASSKGEELDGIEQKIVELEREKNRLQDIGFSLTIALKTLDEAGQEIKRGFAPLLNQKLGSRVLKITGSRYSEINADDGLLLRAVDPDTRQIRAVPLLSSGTVEQVYLALRLALAEVIEDGGEVLPLVLDEIFAHYDDKRVLNTLKMLSEVSQKRQIILFTCKEREVEAAKEIFRDNFNIVRL